MEKLKLYRKDQERQIERRRKRRERDANTHTRARSLFTQPKERKTVDCMTSLCPSRLLWAQPFLSESFSGSVRRRRQHKRGGEGERERTRKGKAKQGTPFFF